MIQTAMCKQCGHAKPLDSKHWVSRIRRDDGAEYLCRARCRECRNALQRRYDKSRRGRQIARARRDSGRQRESEIKYKAANGVAIKVRNALRGKIPTEAQAAHKRAMNWIVDRLRDGDVVKPAACPKCNLSERAGRPIRLMIRFLGESVTPAGRLNHAWECVVCRCKRLAKSPTGKGRGRPTVIFPAPLSEVEFLTFIGAGNLVGPPCAPRGFRRRATAGELAAARLLAKLSDGTAGDARDDATGNPAPIPRRDARMVEASLDRQAVLVARESAEIARGPTAWERAGPCGGLADVDLGVERQLESVARAFRAVTQGEVDSLWRHFAASKN